jgi:hypothetical protein
LFFAYEIGIIAQELAEGCQFERYLVGNDTLLKGW